MLVAERTKVSSSSVKSAHVARVERRLATLGGFADLRVRGQGPHILIERHAQPVARLTELGHEAFGLAFRGDDGRWEPMMVIDTLEELVVDVTVAIS